MLANKVVVHYLDGRILKGTTGDFVPSKDSFHLADASEDRKISEVFTRELKAVFFVKSFSGNPLHKKQSTAEALEQVSGRKLKIAFSDGEVMYGTTSAYTPERPSFFIVPADPGGNNERVYVFRHATTSIEILRPAATMA